VAKVVPDGRRNENQKLGFLAKSEVIQKQWFKGSSLANRAFQLLTRQHTYFANRQSQDPPSHKQHTFFINN